MPYQVYADVDNKPENREHVEECPDHAVGKAIIDYLTERLPKTDRIWGEWGGKPAGMPTFDRSRLREPTKEWPEGEGGPGAAIVANRRTGDTAQSIITIGGG